MSEIRIKGLTHKVDGWTVHNWWRDRPTDPDYVDYGEEDYYGGYSHFVCESLSRSAAQRIVEGLGGYLVDDSYINVGRQLGDGGPFWVHNFHLYSPVSIGRFNQLQTAIDVVTCHGGPHCRIYDASGFMVTEIRTDRGRRPEPSAPTTMDYCPSDLNQHSHAYRVEGEPCVNCGWNPQEHEHVFVQRAMNVFDKCNICGLPSGSAIHVAF